MKRVSVALVLVAFACAARSEPRSRDTEPSPPPSGRDSTDALPPALDAPAVVTVDAPSPAPDQPTTPRTLYPVIKLEPDANGTRVTIGIGKRQGVNKTWKAYLVDKDGRAINRGELTLTLVDDATTSATTKLRSDRIPRDVQAHVDSH